MVMRNHLNKLLVAGIFCLPALGLTGCSGSRKLGFLTPSADRSEVLQGVKDDKAAQAVGVESEVENNRYRSTADVYAAIAGGIGEFTMGVAGGVVGGGVGAIGGGLYAAYNYGSIAKGTADSAARVAKLGSTIASPIGHYAAYIPTYAVIWTAPYVFEGLKWFASKTRDGVEYAASAIYNGLTKTPDISGYGFDDQLEPGFTSIISDNKSNKSSDNQSEYDDSGVDTDNEEDEKYYDAVDRDDN